MEKIEPSPLRFGIGYDIHRLGKGRKLMLGGVEIPYVLGLEGYSDGDALLHAICDAMLGAIGGGDIGIHFPQDDVTYKDISSLELLRRVNKMVLEKGYTVNNVDSVIVAEEPVLGHFKAKMAEVISSVLGIAKDCVNVKATTAEGMGALGRVEGIACYAVVSVKKGG
jgi:2-C-methyl-D-erythritol 2,4-cyclodiphosphate synthase